jgi:lysophospholipase L1-like esterase
MRLLLRHIGLVRPYRFERTLAVLAGLALALLVGAAAVVLVARNHLPLDSPRGWYFLYLGALIALGIAAAPWPKLAAVLLSLAAVEIGLGMGSALLYKYRWASSETLFPRDYRRPPYAWHPLLQAAPLPTSPGQAATARVVINAQGLRGRDRAASELAGKRVIALFGGSTTFDFISPQGETWGERLEELLGRDRYAVINHGGVGYSTAQNLIQTAFYEQSSGAKPRCALYYIGWNDLRSIHVAPLDSGYADFQTRSLVDTLEARRAAGPRLSVSPTLSLIGRIAWLMVDTVRPAPALVGPSNPAPDPALEAIYARNIRSISAINRERGILTLWTGQLLNRSALTADTTDGWVPFVHARDEWPLIEWLNAILRREAAALGDVYIDVPIDDFDRTDFGDDGHFTPKGSLKFATHLAPLVSQTCR